MQLFIVIFSSISILLSGDLFFSEYIEGSNYNKAIEIYNGTGSAIDLSPYTIKQSHNGSGWGINGDGGSGNNGMHYELNLSGYTLEYGDVFIIADDRAAAEIKYFADLILSYGAGDGSKIQAFTGDDAMGLFNNGTLIDVIGTEDEPPSNAWSVAGISNATEGYTLVRKLSVITGNNGDWASSAGTSSDDSEWTVYDKDTFNYFLPFGNYNLNINYSDATRGELTRDMLEGQYNDDQYERFSGNSEHRMVIEVLIQRSIMKDQLGVQAGVELIHWKNPGFDPYKSDLSSGKDIEKWSISMGIYYNIK